MTDMADSSHDDADSIVYGTERNERIGSPGAGQQTDIINMTRIIIRVTDEPLPDDQGRYQGSAAGAGGQLFAGAGGQESLQIDKYQNQNSVNHVQNDMDWGIRWTTGSLKEGYNCCSGSNSKNISKLAECSINGRMVYEGLRQGGPALYSTIKRVVNSDRNDVELDYDDVEQFGGTVEAPIPEVNFGPRPSTSHDPTSDVTFTQRRHMASSAASLIDAHEGTSALKPPRPRLKLGNKLNNGDKMKQSLSAHAKERRVPSSRIERFFTFGQMGVGIGLGVASSMLSKALTPSSNATDNPAKAILEDNPILTEANAELIVNTLCRVRGAALKLGQMLSLQDDTMVNPQLQAIFERVRQSADFMPSHQVHKVLKQELGPDWMDHFAEFEDRPFAAASIGQVHRAVLKNNQEVALKIQYPGVAESINSDIDNLVTVLNVANVLPKTLFMDSFLDVARLELVQECDYRLEAASAKKFADFLKNDSDYVVPAVFDSVTTKEVLCCEMVNGIPLDKCADIEDQEVKNFIGEKLLHLCLRELFEFKFMQSDPNWSNFMYQPDSGKIVLLDFGASRTYADKFIDLYLEVLKAASDRDSDKILKFSRDIGFLTGYETDEMNKAHCEAVLILGAALGSVEPFDFGAQNITKSIHALVPVMLKHRLTPPPQETYSIHRKLSGTFLLCAKLGSKVSCKQLFDRIYSQYSVFK